MNRVRLGDSDMKCYICNLHCIAICCQKTRTVHCSFPRLLAPLPWSSLTTRLFLVFVLLPHYTNATQLPKAVYKISGHPDDSQHCWWMPRFLNLGIRWIAMFYTRQQVQICTTLPVSKYIDGTDAYRFCRTARFNDMGICRIAMFSPLIYTLWWDTWRHAQQYAQASK